MPMLVAICKQCFIKGPEMRIAKGDSRAYSWDDFSMWFEKRGELKWAEAQRANQSFIPVIKATSISGEDCASVPGALRDMPNETLRQELANQMGVLASRLQVMNGDVHYFANLDIPIQ